MSARLSLTNLVHLVLSPIQANCKLFQASSFHAVGSEMVTALTYFSE